MYIKCTQKPILPSEFVFKGMLNWCYNYYYIPAHDKTDNEMKFMYPGDTKSDVNIKITYMYI